MAAGDHRAGMNDAAECLALLTDQKRLLKQLLADVKDRLPEAEHKSEFAMFLLTHGWNVYEMAKGAVLLMEAGEPYTTVVLARSALESAFNMLAASNNAAFGGQKMAQELDELADKIEFFTKAGCWHASRKPTPEDCRKEAKRVLAKYKVERKKWKQIEQIAAIADLSPYYDDDYRFLSLVVHANQTGILNSGTGFLTRKGLLALANAMFVASSNLSSIFCLRAKYDAELDTHQSRMQTMMQKPDLLPRLDDPQAPA
jgi:hypothetical protein